jgi:PIN domain nuclease of toxin-antitoxin system
MKLLLDTLVLIMAATDDARLCKDVRALIEDERNELFFSAATILELVLMGEDAPVNPTRFRMNLLGNDYKELPITSSHSLGIKFLPTIHENPFEQIVISQSRSENAFLLTQNKKSLAHPGVMSAKELAQLENQF